MKIVIATPLFPPHIGGPALYAELFSRTWKAAGHEVTVVSSDSLRNMPSGIRHFLYACKLLPSIFRADVVYVLDTFSVAIPTTILCHILKKKIIVRVGGDFLWESYVNRTYEAVFLSEFYTEERNFTFKENTIFDLTNFVFAYADKIVFSTNWQKDIYLDAYTLDTAKVHVVENLYMQRTKRNIVPKNRVVLSPARDIFLKNKKGLEEAFKNLKERFFDATLDTSTSTHEELLSRISEAYCVVVPSFSEVSPNLVLDAISLGVPVVVTMDCGIKDRLGDSVLWVNPKDPQSIQEGIETLMDARTYSEYMTRMSKFAFERGEEVVARDFLILGS
ncbi:MAG: glycosyltransferase family 4 protein [Candidatus Zambryskibacteria bacterium]|nr:glycosyltransferase family 4 protein [Candidatus Zambryskibacteria bacterium]